MTTDAEAPIAAQIENAGIGRKPLTPVHPRASSLQMGGLHLCCTRRARGEWTWLNEVETPLVEPVESYQVGVGPLGNPLRQWNTDKAELSLNATEVSELSTLHYGETIWVRQIGKFARSDPLRLTVIG